MKLLTFLLVLVASCAAGAKPNIVLIVSDDQGWGDLSLHGNRNLSTPNIDSIGRGGAVFERFGLPPSLGLTERP